MTPVLPKCSERTGRRLAIVLGAAFSILALPGTRAFTQAQPQQPPPQSAGSPEQTDKGQPSDSAAVLPRGKKLVLKDGSYQLVRNYERKGDRVRFYSVERSAWEEIPADLVDWEATRQAEAEAAKQGQELVEKTHAMQPIEGVPELDSGASLEVAPGVFLPDNEGLYIVEGRLVTPMSQSTAGVKLDKGRLLTQVLMPVPVVPTRHKVQLPGKKAELRITTDRPEFYFRTADAREPEVELIRAQVKGDTRLLEFISTNLVGQHSSQRKSISIQRWEAAKGVYRFTLGEALQPGEYALAEILPEGMNLYVWDFGVDAPGSQRQSTNNSPAQAKPKPNPKP